VLSTVRDPDPHPTVRDLVEFPGQFYPVGRLDVDSEGLVLLTNDGDLANRLTHPRYGHEKEYRVLVARRPDAEQLATWRRGVVLADGYKTVPAEVHLAEPSGKGMWLRIVLHEGRKRQIRETGSILGLPVVKIIRVRIGSLLLGGLQPRQWRHLTTQEVAALKQAPTGGKKPARRMQPRVEPEAKSAPRPAAAERPYPRQKPRSGLGETTPYRGQRSEAGRPASTHKRSPRPGDTAPFRGQRSGASRPATPNTHHPRPGRRTPAAPSQKNKK
jgi:23S rRNA pseudouridine2605 synthase